MRMRKTDIVLRRGLPAVWAALEVADIPRAMVDLAYANVYEPEQDAAERERTYLMGEVYA